MTWGRHRQLLTQEDDGTRPASTSLGRPPTRHAGAVAALRRRAAPPPCFLARRASPSAAGARSRGRARARSAAVRLAPPCPARRRRSRRRRARRAPASGRGSPRAGVVWVSIQGASSPGRNPRDATCCATRPGPQAPAKSPFATALSARWRPSAAASRSIQASSGSARRTSPRPSSGTTCRSFETRGLSRSDPPDSRQSASSSSSRVTGRCRFAARYTNASRPWRPGSASSIREPSIRATSRPQSWIRVSAKVSPR